MTPFTRNAIVLGLLSAVGPFAIDMYLPALPAITADLRTSTSATQMTLTMFFIAFGLCQIAYGPLSDVYGRKAPLYAGLALFILGSIGCTLAPSVAWLIAFRCLQGAGAAAMAVIPRAIIRDLHTGVEATKLMALVMLVFSVSPILAPLTGSALIVPFGWRAVFVAVTVAAVIGLALVAALLPETRPAHERISGSVRNVLGSFAELLRDGHFLGLTFIGGLGMASFFAFLATSSFVYIGHYGLSPTQYSLAFSVNAIGFIGASQFAGHLGGRFGMARVVMAAVSAYAAFAVLLLALTLMGFDSLRVLIPLLFVSFAFLGLVIPSTMVLALENHGPIAGIAAALGGTLQMVTGGAMIAVAGLFFDGTSLPMVATIAVTAVGALLVSLATLRKREPAAAMAE
ncbi:MAG: drug transporter protein Bcr/CflA family [Tardiphaga sp.]|jgi:MFS transporter, DHA1 family, multidrug resistance protein|uniref:multidrug effflux MFS transporter n=1 Tax=Tardiphaga sp. TaxID=1926292 RepID=UPI002625835A|nr:multidrug effflux MFS transporter [Tardiphaga sp.]MDB5503355.1 drug transporter protein Bcr/CflA family [Tardiphaga sp.]